MRIYERMALMTRRAEELARSGKFRDSVEVEQHLRTRENYPEIREWLADSFRREHLDRLCADARANQWT